jgi:hypothetical protein
VGGKYSSLLLDYEILLFSPNGIERHAMWLLLDTGKVRIPHILLDILKKTLLWHIKVLLPHWSVWKQQRTCCNGDKSELCNKFLNHFIPYFIEVLVQDGAWFVKDFLSHTLSQVPVLIVTTLHYCVFTVLTYSLLTNYCTFTAKILAL